MKITTIILILLAATKLALGASTQTFYNVKVANGHSLILGNTGITNWTQISGGSQTPWTSNIDGGMFNLSNVYTGSFSVINLGEADVATMFTLRPTFAEATNIVTGYNYVTATVTNGLLSTAAAAATYQTIAGMSAYAGSNAIVNLYNAGTSGTTGVIERVGNAASITFPTGGSGGVAIRLYANGSQFAPGGTDSEAASGFFTGWNSIYFPTSNSLAISTMTIPENWPTNATAYYLKICWAYINGGTPPSDGTLKVGGIETSASIDNYSPQDMATIKASAGGFETITWDTNSGNQSFIIVTNPATMTMPTIGNSYTIVIYPDHAGFQPCHLKSWELWYDP